MRVYLQEDNVREPLKKAIEGLRGCCQDIERAARGLKWRKRDKQKAVQAFLSTLGDLDVQYRPWSTISFLSTVGKAWALLCQFMNWSIALATTFVEVVRWTLTPMKRDWRS